MAEKLLKKYHDPGLADLTPEAEERGVRSLIAALIAQDREEQEFWRRVEEDMPRVAKEIEEVEKDK